MASWDELRPHFDIVVNAVGFAAKWMAEDKDVHAARGQTIRVYAPHIRRFATTTSGTDGEFDNILINMIL